MILEKIKEGKDNIRPIETKVNLIMLLEERETRLREQQIKVFYESQWRS